MYSSETFYTKFAGSYAEYALTKNSYLSAIDEFVIRESKNSAKMIDIGSGNGIRSKKIADSIKVSELTLVDNSHGMVSLLKNIEKASVILDDISNVKFKSKDKFEIVTCLWNVIGHIPTIEERSIAMKNIRESLMQDGLAFIDVNNRYNISEYGLRNVIKNIFKDIILRRKTNGNFELKVRTDREIIKTEVHIFYPFEMNRLIKSSGLKIIKRQIINYQTGKKCRSILGGQLVYKLSRL